MNKLLFPRFVSYQHHCGARSATLLRATQELNNATNLDEGVTLVVRGVKEHVAADDMTRLPSGPSAQFNGGAARPCSTAEEGKCTG